MLKALKGQPPVWLSPLKEECVFQQFSGNVSLFSVLLNWHLNAGWPSKHPLGFTLCAILCIVLSSCYLIILWFLYSLFYFGICKFRLLLILLLLFCQKLWVSPALLQSVCDKDHLYEKAGPSEPLLCCYVFYKYIYISNTLSCSCLNILCHRNFMIFIKNLHFHRFLQRWLHNQVVLLISISYFSRWQSHFQEFCSIT